MTVSLVFLNVAFLMNKAKGRVFTERRRYREGVFLLCGAFNAEDMRYQQYNLEAARVFI